MICMLYLGIFEKDEELPFLLSQIIHFPPSLSEDSSTPQSPVLLLVSFNEENSDPSLALWPSDLSPAVRRIHIHIYIYFLVVSTH